MAIDYKDYYATLGVSRDASPEQIKQAFRKLARKYHPAAAATAAPPPARPLVLPRLDCAQNILMLYEQGVGSWFRRWNV